jgi:hypothetical protein
MSNTIYAKAQSIAKPCVTADGVFTQMGAGQVFCAVHDMNCGGL